MGAEQPFLYDPPSQNGYPHRHFNPKAASQASFERPTPRPKHEGPLIDFNKHPDSYVIVPYGNLNAKPMSPRTRKRVSYLRWTQLLFRLLELTGAVGMLVCAICVRQVDDTMGWTLRIPVGSAISMRTWHSGFIAITNRDQAWCCNHTLCLCYIPPIAEPVQENARILCELYALRHNRRHEHRIVLRLHSANKQHAIY